MNGTVRKPGRPKGLPKTGGGSRSGVPNKATTDARKAIALFVDGNAHRLAGWLDEVAEGVLKPDGDEYAVSPNPAKAFELFQSVVEYHVPKLARTELAHSGSIDTSTKEQKDAAVARALRADT